MLGDLKEVLDSAAELRAAAKAVGRCGWGTSVSESEHFSRMATMDRLRAVIDKIDAAEKALFEIPQRRVDPAQPDDSKWLDTLETLEKLKNAGLSEIAHGFARHRWLEYVSKLQEAAPRLIAIARARTDQAEAFSIWKAGKSNWAYAPCSVCGALEGMGLTTPKSAGPGNTCVWCCNCDHEGPAIPNGPDRNASDRACAIAWNREFYAVFTRNSIAPGDKPVQQERGTDAS